MRSLAILLLAAWAIKFVARIGCREDVARISRDGLRSLLRTPLAVPTLLLALALIVATVLSLSPWESFWRLGSRRDGTYTQLSCLLFFAAIAASLRSEERVHGIITVAILTSLPISLYGIGQRFSIEPAIFQGGGMFRVGSTLGNAVFLGACLIMVLPLTLSRALLSFWGDRAARQQSIQHPVQGFVYVLIALVQICAIAFTVSRGPTLGLVAGCVVRFLIKLKAAILASP